MSEHDEQVAFIAWTELQKQVYPHVNRFFAVPNGGQRHKAVATKMKAEGVKAGVPDLLLLLPRGGYHGLVIEMKYGKNNITDSQSDWLDFLASQGYYTAICWGCDEAIQATVDYYDL